MVGSLLEERNKLAPLFLRERIISKDDSEGITSDPFVTDWIKLTWGRKKINRDDAERDDRREMEEKGRKKKKKNGGLEEGGCVGRKENPPGN